MPPDTTTTAVTTFNDLGRTLTSQLYEIVTGGDESVPASPNNFLSWCMPGIPFDPADFQFAAKGLGGGATAEEERLLLLQAYNFAHLIDFIPDPSGIFDGKMQETVFRTSAARLSSMYGEILRFSKVVHAELSDKEKAKLDKFRGLLRTTKTVKNIVSDEEKQVVVDGPMLQAYNEKFDAYLTAALAYNSKRVAALSATGPEGKFAVQDWAMSAPLYRLQVKQAADAWVAGGYRNEVDEINAYINQVTQRNMMLWKQALLEHYHDAVVSALGPGQEFFYTTLIPGSFATSAGWTRYSMSHETARASSQSKSNAFGGGVGLQFGLFSLGGGGSYESSSMSGDSAVTSFRLSFELVQVAISRAWFYPEFFMNRGWTLRKGEGWPYPDMLSDGKIPPSGVCIAYPTTALFARNITIESKEFVSAYKALTKSIGAGGSIGWGPFRLSGSYHRQEGSSDFSSSATDQSLTVPGMQIIGFVNHLIGKAPDPLPELKETDFA